MKTDKDKVMQFLAELEFEYQIRIVDCSSSEKDLCNYNLTRIKEVRDLVEKYFHE